MQDTSTSGRTSPLSVLRTEKFVTVCVYDTMNRNDLHDFMMLLSTLSLDAYESTRSKRTKTNFQVALRKGCKHCKDSKYFQSVYWTKALEQSRNKRPLEAT